MKANNIKPKNGAKKKASGGVKKKIRSMRNSSMKNPDGTSSSHKMAWVGDQNKRRGEFGVFPTIRPKDGVGMSSNPSDWTTQGPMDATQRGEMIKVKSRRRAEKLAAGSWKKGKDRRKAMKDYRSRKKSKK